MSKNNLKIMLINGPNINMLGVREKGIYGQKSYVEIVEYITKEGKDMLMDIDPRQSNIEGEIINFIHEAYNEEYDGIIINPAAYTHYSIAILDAIKAVNIPTVEVHLSNIHSREEFRHKSVTAQACIGQICGFGDYGYIMALHGIKEYLNRDK